jgi:hypothetical protein
MNHITAALDGGTAALCSSQTQASSPLQQTYSRVETAGTDGTSSRRSPSCLLRTSTAAHLSMFCAGLAVRSFLFRWVRCGVAA